MKALISAVAIALLAMNPRHIAADEKSDEATYRKALALLKDVQADKERSFELDTKRKKADSVAEKERLRQELLALVSTVDANEGRARELLETIAPRDRKGYGPAQVALAEILYVNANLRAQTVLDCERHLLNAVDWPDPAVQTKARFHLARLYRDVNRFDDAKKQLVIIAEKHPEYHLMLAEWAKKAGDKDDVIVDQANAALAAFSERLKKDASDHEARFGCVSSLILLAKFAEARQMVNEGAALATTPETVRAYARKLSEVFVASFDAKEIDPKLSATARFEILEQAVKLDPENPDIYNRMLRMTKDKSIAEKVRKRLRELTESGKASWMGNLYLGIDAYQNQKTEAAREYWGKALKQSNGAPLVANNLAWLLAYTEPLDLPRALELASDAVDKSPNESRYRGTYGHILVKLGRYKEALPELEKAIAAYPTDANLFRALSETCGKLGDNKKAEEYKKRADALDMKREAGG